MKYQLQFEVCRLINTQSVLKIPFQIAKTRENAKIVLKIIFSTVLAFSRVFNFFLSNLQSVMTLLFGLFSDMAFFTHSILEKLK